MQRLPVVKTHKLFIGGAFPRTESGRSTALKGASNGVIAHLCRASRKDLRQAVEAARAALPAWSRAAPYLRGQILYRFAEMLEGRAAELASALRATSSRSAASTQREVRASIDRLVSMAGWSDKLAMVLGGQNPVAGPYYTFTTPEPVGVCVTIAESSSPLLAFVSLAAPALVAGNTVVAIACERHPLAALLLAESAPTSDLPAGVLNLLTGELAELMPHLASHRDVDAIVAAVPARHAPALRCGAAENLKRVRLVDPGANFEQEEPWSGASAFDGLVELKTIWHPMSA
ncbi:MAG: aldehyde dehydrogenase [Phycisphaerae bacterium]|nr:aldehyde dehydrogenase [Phycisphaerae bacterium]